MAQNVAQTQGGKYNTKPTFCSDAQAEQKYTIWSICFRNWDGL